MRQYTEPYVHPSSGAKIPAREIVHLPVSELTKYRWDSTARTRTARGSAGHSYAETKAWVAEHGVQDPITLGEVMGAIRVHDGHHRLLAAEELGLDRIPVALHENLGERKRRFIMGSLER
jgi:ParB-like chromosome segregation protein Spo0J